MASLTNPINAQNIVNRFADYVVATANSGISYGSNSWPFYDGAVDLSGSFGGTTSGKAIGITGTGIIFPNGDKLVRASYIYSELLAETRTYVRIRYHRWQLYVAGDGGNNGSRTTPGYIVNVRGKSYLNPVAFGEVPLIAPAALTVSASNTITSAALEALFDRLRTAYSNATNTDVSSRFDVCHASCHTSCHSSRSRR